MQNKPSSKVIQSITNKSTAVWTVLCEDGSIWSKTTGGDWECILEAPTQPKSDLPEVGSRWRARWRAKNKKNYKVFIMATNRIIIQDEYAECYNYSPEEFLEVYEPIPTQSDNKE